MDLTVKPPIRKDLKSIAGLSISFYYKYLEKVLISRDRIRNKNRAEGVRLNTAQSSSQPEQCSSNL